MAEDSEEMFVWGDDFEAILAILKEDVVSFAAVFRLGTQRSSPINYGHSQATGRLKGGQKVHLVVKLTLFCQGHVGGENQRKASIKPMNLEK